MPELKKHDIVVKYINESRPDIRSIYTPREIAQRIYWDWDDYRIGPRREIIEITVDGETYTTDQLKR